MIKQKKEEISISRKTEHWIDWIVVGVFAVIVAIMLLSLQVKTPKFTKEKGREFSSYERRL